MRLSVPLAIAASFGAFAGDAQALPDAAGCDVVLRTEDADPAWQEAVRELRTRLVRPGTGEVDCGAIEIRIDGQERTVVFTTRDGRRAERPVLGPRGLLAVVEALEVTIPEPAAPPVELAGGPPPQATARFVVDGSGGLRIAGAGASTFGSVTVRLGVGANVGHWELGVLGRYDPAQAPWVGPALPGFAMSTYALGLRAGRRDRLGPLDGVAGLTASIGVTDETQTSSGPNGTNQQADEAPITDKIDPLLGVYAGFLVPRRSTVRLRPQLTFDVAASRINQAVGPAGLPLPWWSTAVSVGVEWESR